MIWIDSKLGIEDKMENAKQQFNMNSSKNYAWKNTQNIHDFFFQIAATDNDDNCRAIP